MPQRTGFQLHKSLEDAPQLIFTTAYDEHALRAFEVGALDYLLKPISPARPATALSRLRERLAAPKADVLPLDRPLLVHSPAGIEQHLDPDHFFRASRGTIVNLGFAERFETGARLERIAHLRDGRIVEFSRRQSVVFWRPGEI